MGHEHADYFAGGLERSMRLHTPRNHLRKGDVRSSASREAFSIGAALSSQLRECGAGESKEGLENRRLQSLQILWNQQALKRCLGQRKPRLCPHQAKCLSLTQLRASNASSVRVFRTRSAMNSGSPFAHSQRISEEKQPWDGKPQAQYSQA